MISFSEAKAARRKKSRPTERILQLNLVLRDSDPPIWRRMQVRESMWLSRLHDAIQIAFGWFDYQVHRFAVGSTLYGNPVRRENETLVEDDRDFSIADLDLGVKDTFIYEYCFGDFWRVDISVEKLEPAKKGVRYPHLTGGHLNGPPEDCGGPAGYKEVLYSLKHPEEPLSKEWLDWLGEGFDPQHLDLAKLNKALAKLPK
ncbi:MAG TPA: plasmid pRiA4b ORF-3 family protein [Opitutaceae bacterium]|nr:plasmid pRiA4b ORF-3 family protein [Opitutaceae bacterium]